MVFAFALQNSTRQIETINQQLSPESFGYKILRPSASLGDGLHMYEPSGGSAPDIAGSEMNLFPVHCG